MSYIKRNLVMVVTYWAPGAPTGKGGFTYATPVTIKGRWQERTEMFVDVAGKEQRARSRVYVDTDVEMDGYLALGDQTATANPATISGTAFPIKDFRKTPNLRATEFERRCLL